MRIVAVVMDPEQIARLCDHLGEPAQAPVVQPSRYQVQTQWDFPAAPVGKPVPDGQGDFVGEAPPQWDWVDPPAPPD